MFNKVRGVILFTCVLLLLVPGAILAQAAVTHDVIEDTVDLQEYVPCAADGAGESVKLSGDLHIVFHTTVDDNGGAHFSYQFNPQGVIGVGQTTGDIYRGTGVSRGTFNGREGELVNETEVDVFQLIGPGPGNNFRVHGIFHVTVNANGDVTAFVDSYTIECN